MKEDSKVTIGQVVKSKAGRDKGRLFIVIEVVDDEFVYIVDGDLRKLDKPKLKKVKHLVVYSTVFTEVGYKLDNKIKISNEYIRKLLEPIK
ncbi:MAG TPA: KOW domain-containing RNA-binding protein [Tissierellaceae bacterium]